MAFGKRTMDKYASKATSSFDTFQFPEPQDPRLPGVAGYPGVKLKKNAMPPMRFNYVRPDQQQHR